MDRFAYSCKYLARIVYSYGTTQTLCIFSPKTVYLFSSFLLFFPEILSLNQKEHQDKMALTRSFIKDHDKEFGLSSNGLHDSKDVSVYFSQMNDSLQSFKDKIEECISSVSDNLTHVQTTTKSLTEVQTMMQRESRDEMSSLRSLIKEEGEVTKRMQDSTLNEMKSDISSVIKALSVQLVQFDAAWNLSSADVKEQLDSVHSTLRDCLPSQSDSLTEISACVW